ncbi:CU044_5270 family protein [Streptomyces sp. NPDC052301]|uniref:CU044_5270 family protein n=1 Tax=Streptomyces sp. NPDC052301 TaxID=3365687 RepID=UPI0037D420CA
MDELTRVREWGTDERGPSTRARSAARARLTTAIEDETRGTAPGVRRPSRRIVVRGALAGLTAAAAGAAVVVTRGADHGTGDGRAPRLDTVSATQVLHRAADRTRAAGSTLPVPRDDQYFYTRTFIRRTPVKGGRTRTWTDESWMSVDGSKPSLREEYGKVHHDPPLGPHEVVWPPTVYAKLQKMPTDPDRLLARFRGSEPDDPHRDLRVFFEGCMLMMGPRVMPPGLQAAAFEMLSKLPRIRLDRGATDVAGRKVVGVSYPESSFTFLFDRTTYDYMGLRTEGSVPKKVHGEWKQTGFYYETRTLRELQVVDRIGQHR